MRVLVTGATSMIGDFLLPMLVKEGHALIVTSRKPHAAQDGIKWIYADLASVEWMEDIGSIDCWINVASLKFLPALLPEAAGKMGIKRLITFSSTSKFTKAEARGEYDRSIASSLAEEEDSVERICNEYGIAQTIFRPTLIYCLGRDKNITLIADKIRRFGFFPLVGSGKGLRQPVHAEDLAKACVQAMGSEKAANKVYNLSGSEILSYRVMVARLFELHGMEPKFIRIPLFLFRTLIDLLRLLPKYHYLTPDMADRMEKDMVFPHNQAQQDFGFAPRNFEPQLKDRHCSGFDD